MSYINNYSWKCLLGPQSKNIHSENGIHFWSVGKKNHFCTAKQLALSDLDLVKNHSFHYLSTENALFIKQNYGIQKTRNVSTVIDLSQMTFVGNKYKSLRHTLNRGKGYGLVIEDNFRKIKDVEDMLEEWSNVLAQKYFRDFSGKNFFFYKNNHHIGCNNVFLYDGDKLVSFATASPIIDGYCSYIIGKALCNKYYGLSEYTDVVLYGRCSGKIDLGQTTGGLVHYKSKFPGASTYYYYDGKVI